MKPATPATGPSPARSGWFRRAARWAIHNTALTLMMIAWMLVFDIGARIAYAWQDPEGGITRAVGNSLYCQLAGGTGCTIVGQVLQTTYDPGTTCASAQHVITPGGSGASDLIACFDGVADVSVDRAGNALVGGTLGVTGLATVGALASTGTASANGALSVNGALIHTAESVSFSSAVTNTLTTSTLTNGHLKLCTCTSGSNCPLILGAPSVNYQVITIQQVSAQQCVIQASSGATAAALPAAAATLTLGALDSITLHYITGTGWITDAYSDN